MPDAYPYLVPPSETVAFLPWTTIDDMPLEGAADGWDAATDLRIRRIVKVSTEEVRQHAGLSAQVPLRLSTSWRSSSSGVIKGSSSVMVNGAGSQYLEAVLPGHEVGGSLRIVTTLSLAANWDAPPGVASTAGCVLAQDEVTLAVEGNAPQFPLEVVDFSSTGWDADASWHLTVKDDMAAPFLGTVWLSINSRDRELLKAIEAVRKSSSQQALLDAMYADVGEQLVEAAEVAERTSAISETRWPDESLGAALAVLVEHRGQMPATSATDIVGEAADLRTARQGVVRRMGIGRRFS